MYFAVSGGSAGGVAVWVGAGGDGVTYVDNGSAWRTAGRCRVTRGCAATRVGGAGVGAGRAGGRAAVVAVHPAQASAAARHATSGATRGPVRAGRTFVPLRRSVSGSTPGRPILRARVRGVSAVVVGAAILDGDPPGCRVLVTQRAEPPHLAGLWEFPGGKVEPGEPDVDALVRECREELDVEVAVGERLGGDLLLDGPRGPWVLRVWVARIVRGDVRLVEHRDARWLAASELDDVPWIPADAPLVDALRALLAP
jgi:8-oxo-dGTP diphosphatase